MLLANEFTELIPFWLTIGFLGGFAFMLFGWICNCSGYYSGYDKGFKIGRIELLADMDDPRLKPPTNRDTD